jgi:hypothetical protein
MRWGHVERLRILGLQPRIGIRRGNSAGNQRSASTPEDVVALLACQLADTEFATCGSEFATCGNGAGITVSGPAI